MQKPTCTYKSNTLELEKLVLFSVHGRKQLQINKEQTNLYLTAPMPVMSHSCCTYLSSALTVDESKWGGTIKR